MMPHTVKANSTFETDEVATAYYAGRSNLRQRGTGTSEFWFAFQKFVEQTANEEEENAVIETLGPTPGVSGFVPKLISQISLDSQQAWSGKLFGAQSIPAIVKLEQRLYPGLLALEALSYDYHRRAKTFDVPRTWLTTLEHHGETVTLLASERFDRKGDQSVPQESFFSLLHTGNRHKYHCNTDGSMEDLAKILTVLGLPIKDRDEWYQRFVMAILTGNGDLHTENMAVVGGKGQAHLSPLYDPAPMRAYRGRASHDILSALPFSEIGGVLQETYRPFAASGKIPPDLGKRLVAFGKTIGIPVRRAKQFIDHLLDVTTDFRDEAITTLETVPLTSRRNKRAPDIDGFATTLSEVREAITRSLGR